MKKKFLVTLSACISLVGLWFASEWWEKGLASPWGEAKISPDGCSRVQAFKPFWLLPDKLHREFAPNENGKAEWFPTWELPGFYRLYNHHTNQLIGETVIYDLAFSGGRLSWHRSGDVYVGLTYLGKAASNCLGKQPDSTSNL
ncbi:hypothetical protein [Pseudomonas japonica]|uniref:hypothetical protein n=1 Tax=Pseudomonas japonica TaxID=256466 RepID=UPI000B793B59|nr:hypothetical protein [Pseudomonas japonica]